MAEPVIVTNADWATEETARDMLEVMKEHFKLTEKAANNILKALKKGESGATDIVKNQKEYKEKVKEITDATEEHKEVLEEDKNTLIKHEKSLDKSASSLGLFTASTAVARAALKRFTAVSYNLGKSMLVMGTAIGGVLVNRSMEYASMALDLERQGVAAALRYQTGTESAMTGLARATTIAGVKLNNMTEYMSNFGSAIQKYGIEGFASSVRSISSDVARFGMTASEAGEYLGDYLDQQRSLGVLTKINARQQQIAARENLQQTIAFSKALGVSRDEILRRQRAGMEDTNVKFVTAMIGELGKDVSNEFRKVSSVLGEGMTSVVGDMVLAQRNFGSVLASDTYAGIVKGGAQNFASIMEQMALDIEAGRDVDIAGVLEQFKNTVGLEERELVSTIARRTGNTQLLDMINSMTEAGESFSQKQYELALDAERNSEKLAEAQATLANAFMKTFGSLQASFAEFVGSNQFAVLVETLRVKVLEPIALAIRNNLPFFRKMLIDGAEYLNKFTTSLSDFIQGIFKESKDTGKNIFSILLSRIEEFMNIEGSGESLTESIGKRVGDILVVGVETAIENLVPAMEVIGKALGNIIVPAVGAVFSGLYDSLKDHPAIAAFLGVFAVLAGALKPVFVVGKLLKGVTKGLFALSRGIIATVSAITSVGDKVKLGPDILKGLRGSLHALTGIVKSSVKALGKVLTPFSSMWRLMKGMVAGVPSMYNALKSINFTDMGKSLGRGAWKFLTSGLNGLGNFWKSIRSIGRGMFSLFKGSGVFTLIIASVEGLFHSVKEFFTALSDGDSIFEALKKSGIAFIVGFKDSIFGTIKMFMSVGDWLLEKLSSAVSYFLGLFGLETDFLGFYRNFKETISGWADKIIGSFKSIGSWVAEKWKEIDAKEIFSSLVDTIVGFLSDGFKFVKDAVISAVPGASAVFGVVEGVAEKGMEKGREVASKASRGYSEAYHSRLEKLQNATIDELRARRKEIGRFSIPATNDAREKDYIDRQIEKMLSRRGVNGGSSGSSRRSSGNVKDEVKIVIDGSVKDGVSSDDATVTPRAGSQSTRPSRFGERKGTSVPAPRKPMEPIEASRPDSASEIVEQAVIANQEQQRKLQESINRAMDSGEEIEVLKAQLAALTQSNTLLRSIVSHTRDIGDVF